MKPNANDKGLADQSRLRRAWEAIQYAYWGLHYAIKWKFHKKNGGSDGKTVPGQDQ